MNRRERLFLLSEKTALIRMIAETPADEVIDLSSLRGRLEEVEAQLVLLPPDDFEPTRVRLTFAGRPVVGGHGLFAEFGMKAVTGFTETVTAMAAARNAPLASVGPLPNRAQSQLLITGTAIGSFGFELEEHRREGNQPADGKVLSDAIERTQALFRGAVGTDDELADSAADIDRRALDKARQFLETLVDNEATCTVLCGESVFRFQDVAEVRRSVARLSHDNLLEDHQELQGQFQGVLPRARMFEFALSESSDIIRGKVGPSVLSPELLNGLLHRQATIRVVVTRVGNGRPRYVLVDAVALA